jgi:hypothetical protein
VTAVPLEESTSAVIDWNSAWNDHNADEAAAPVRADFQRRDLSRRRIRHGQAAKQYVLLDTIRLHRLGVLHDVRPA